MNGPLYMQASNNVVIVRRIKRKGEGPMKQLSRWFVENQIGTPALLVARSYAPRAPRPPPTHLLPIVLPQECLLLLGLECVSR